MGIYVKQVTYGVGMRDEAIVLKAEGPIYRPQVKATRCRLCAAQVLTAPTTATGAISNPSAPTPTEHGFYGCNI